MKISPTREMHPAGDEAQSTEAGKTMFEIYRESHSPRKAHVIYYTELPEVQHKNEIDKAFAGDSIYSGFLWDDEKLAAKEKIRHILNRINDEDDIAKDEIEAELHAHLAS